MKKVFIVTGELSGDLLGAWYVTKQYSKKDAVYIEALGGDNLSQAGAILYERFETLNVTGIVEIIKHIPRILRFLHQLAVYIISKKFDEVVLIDFPGFNIRLSKKLKKLNPSLKITYFSPPQLWCWGAWRLASLKKYCDRLVVLYPFEVAWYAQRGAAAEWIGSPVYERISPYFEQSKHKRPLVALVPGSRLSEIKTVLPLLAQVARALKKEYPELRFIIPQASSLSDQVFRRYVTESGLLTLGESLTVIGRDHNTWEQLAHCCFAISKPGTVTLELALLEIPSIILFKVPWLTYWIARQVVRVQFMSLPNLLMGKEIFKEYIQKFTLDEVVLHAKQVYEQSRTASHEHHKRVNDFECIKKCLQKEQITHT